ncbi:MAG: alanine--tRNA ligase-related protein [bacterium]|nr:alanine--tRNA ligase-related protein [bacterium]
MTVNEVRQRFLKFFEARGHTIVTSAPLVPENDPSVLFTTAGMQQFKPYYTGEKDALKDFGSKNAVSIQKCIRTSDIDEVGDATHLTFFEMLGNFSFGGYVRKEAIAYAHEFITKELELSISYVTVYKGSENVPRDEKSKENWKSLGVVDVREEGADVFWGPTGNAGPCGPTTEIYCKDANGKDVEIWNIVFNEYFCNGSREQLDKGEAKLTKLPFLGIDTGMGLERLAAILQKKESVYETDAFPTHPVSRSERIVADHTRAAEALIQEGVEPSNIGRGYVLRRLIRRAVLHADRIGTKISDRFKDEETRFRKTLTAGLKEFEKGTDPFVLFTSYGFPLELTRELAKEKGVAVDTKEFEKAFEKHKEISRAGAEKKFKGGLADTSEMSVKYHTATHLLHQALRDVLGNEVQQKGSNITPERLRFDFAFPRKMTDEEKKRVEEIVNEKIKEGLPVQKVILPLSEAKKTGALHFFDEKYPDEVLVHYVGSSLDTAYSKEFCGGPHIANTGVLGTFKIAKEEAVSAGVRRIKATLE